MVNLDLFSLIVNAIFFSAETNFQKVLKSLLKAMVQEYPYHTIYQISEWTIFYFFFKLISIKSRVKKWTHR
jgi:hypothetical protein